MATQTQDERVAKTSLATQMLQRPELGALIGAAVIFFLFWSFDTTGNFAAVGGTAGWTDIAAPIGIIAVFVALLMIGGEFDLSTGVMVGTSGLLAGLLATEFGLNIWLSIAIVFAFALLVGFINGLIVVKTGLPSFIVTLATFFVLRGANLAVTKELTGTVRVANVEDAIGFDQAHAVFASKMMIGTSNFQVSIVWWILATIFCTWLLTRTQFGNWIFASGGDKNAARNAGVPVGRTKITLFMMSSLASAFVGVMFVLRLQGMQAGQGVGMEFFYIIAAAVGGTLLMGGAGSAIGASIGAAIMGIADIGIPYALWDQDWRWTFIGVILLTAVLVNTYIGNKAKGAKR
ncbi:MAG: ABC transporter permease [Microbacteriaceae bacterium]|jgi:simple sugar transport system permease protein|nr:ABC transporter permease [Microbacteriaceae bacterium]